MKSRTPRTLIMTYPHGITFTREEENLFKERTLEQFALNKFFNKWCYSRYIGSKEDERTWERMQTSFDLKWGHKQEWQRWHLWKTLNQNRE